MNEIQSFVLEDSGIRGALVRLEETWQQVVAAHDYPLEVRTLLGEGVVSTLLLASGLKATPSVSLQLQGEGPLKLLLVQCTDGQRVRGMASFKAHDIDTPLLGDGKLVVNLDTGKPNGFFQGIVPLTSTKLEECLESYFAQSGAARHAPRAAQRQATRSGPVAASVAGARRSARERCVRDGGGLRGHGLGRGADALGGRRAVAEAVRGAVDPIVFELGPSRTTAAALRSGLPASFRMLGPDEVKSLLAEQGHVELKCEFCNRAFRYDDAQVDAILRGIRKRHRRCTDHARVPSRVFSELRDLRMTRMTRGWLE